MVGIMKDERGKNGEGSQSAVTVSEVSTPHFVVRYPNFLQPLTFAGADFVLALQDERLLFRPNVVFTSIRSSEALVDASVAALLAAPAQHPGAKILSVDFFWGALASTESPPPGRVIQFSYADGIGRELLVKKWIVATGCHHLHMTATCLTSQMGGLEETFDWIAQTLSLPDAKEETWRMAADEGHAILDDAATLRAGFPVEQLEGLQDLCAYTEQEFPRAELATVASVRGITGAEDRIVGIHVRRGETIGSYSALLMDPGVAVIRSGGCSAFDINQDMCELYGLSGEQLLSDVFAWAGVEPRFVFDGGQTLKTAEFEKNVCGIEDENSEKICWTEYQFEFPSRQWAVVFVPAQGLFEIVTLDSDVVELYPLTSARFVSVIQGQFSEAFAGSIPSAEEPK